MNETSPEVASGIQNHKETSSATSSATEKKRNTSKLLGNTKLSTGTPTTMWRKGRKNTKRGFLKDLKRDHNCLKKLEFYMYYAILTQ